MESEDGEDSESEHRQNRGGNAVAERVARRPLKRGRPAKVPDASAVEGQRAELAAEVARLREQVSVLQAREEVQRILEEPKKTAGSLASSHPR